MAYNRAEQVTSFLSRIKYAGENQCWLWTGCTYNGGSGSFKWRGKMRGTNRVAWEIAHGKDCPDDMDVCHSCDNRLCVNPRHLWLGTAHDNSIDMHKKGRQPVNALTPDQVREIRKLLGTMPQRKLAAKFGVKQGVICDLNTGQTYRWVD